MRRRAAALGGSVIVHLAVLSALLVRGRAERLAMPQGPEVEQVSAAEVASPDEQLSSTGQLDDTFEAASRTDDFAFDLAKISSRENALFPFLTLDLMFLTRVSHEVHDAQQRLSNPLAGGSRGAAAPLQLSDEELQGVVDRAWSRRERWKTFGEIVTLLGSHDPDAGRAADVIRGYLDQNILQPYCDGRKHDPRFWAMLENAADHADFIDFVRSYARRYPSSRTTTELLFLLDELAQGSRDVILMLVETRPDRDLLDTRTKTPKAYQLADALKDRYGRWLFDRGLDKGSIRRHYDELRLRLLQTIIDTTPNGYRAGDAQFLAGQVLFEMNRFADADRVWRGMSPVATDAYYRPAVEIVSAFESGAGDTGTIRRILGNEYGRWRLFSIDRLRHFGHHCDTF